MINYNLDGFFDRLFSVMFGDYDKYFNINMCIAELSNDIIIVFDTIKKIINSNDMSKHIDPFLSIYDQYIIKNNKVNLFILFSSPLRNNEPFNNSIVRINKFFRNIYNIKHKPCTTEEYVTTDEIYYKLATIIIEFFDPNDNMFVSYSL